MAMGSFALDLKKFEDKAGKLMRVIPQKIAMEAFKRVVEKSPVDTGRFRANWGVMIGSPYQGQTDETDKTGAATIAKIQGGVLQWSGDGKIYLCNNLPYSIVLEYGHSKVKAPAGMVRVTVAELQAGIAGIARNASTV